MAAVNCDTVGQEVNQVSSRGAPLLHMVHSLLPPWCGLVEAALRCWSWLCGVSAPAGLRERLREGEREGDAPLRPRAGDGLGVSSNHFLRTHARSRQHCWSRRLGKQKGWTPAAVVSRKEKSSLVEELEVLLGGPLHLELAPVQHHLVQLAVRIVGVRRPAHAPACIRKWARPSEEAWGPGCSGGVCGVSGRRAACVWRRTRAWDAYAR